LVWRDIGSPEVRDTVRDSRVIGGLTIRPDAGAVSISGEADWFRGRGEFRAFRFGGTWRAAAAAELMGLLAWNGDGDFEAIWLGVRVPLGAGAATGAAQLDSNLDARRASVGLRWVDPER
jgi:hypothetical protein